MQMNNISLSHRLLGGPRQNHPSPIKGLIDAFDPENIRLLNWNIYKGKRGNWARHFCGFIKEHDIVTIQEAHLSEHRKYILARQNCEWTLNVAFHLDNRASGVMTASRVAALNTIGMRHTEPLIRTAKTALFSYYPIKGSERPLLVANIHGINFTLGTRAYRRQIENLFQVAHQHEGAIAIAGDFNTWSRTRMEMVQGYATAAGFLSLDYTRHVRKRFFGKALDHVFYRGLDPVAHHSWKVDSSDHNPTRVRFKLL